MYKIAVKIHLTLILRKDSFCFLTLVFAFAMKLSSSSDTPLKCIFFPSSSSLGETDVLLVAILETLILKLQK